MKYNISIIYPDFHCCWDSGFYEGAIINHADPVRAGESHVLHKVCLSGFEATATGPPMALNTTALNNKIFTIYSLTQ